MRDGRTQDGWLLRRYVKENSQTAFSELVRRYMDLVYCTCLRELGDASLAEDATQAVFLIFARKTPSFRQGTVLSSWLFQTALLTSKNVRRQEARRRQREERTAAFMEQTTPRSPEGWEKVEPLLNDALPAAQRALVLERFWEDRPLAEIGQALGITEDAARMRLNRALDRLRRWFAARNVILSAAALAAGLSLAARASPARCAEAVLRVCLTSKAAPASSPNIHAIAQGVIHTMNLKRLQLRLGAAALVAALSLGTAEAVRVSAPAKVPTIAAETQQGQARALAVLNQMYAAYAAMRSFRCNVTSREDMTGTAQDATYEIQRPNKIRFHRVTLLGADISGQALAVSDGSSLFVTCTENKGLEDRYAKLALDPSVNTDYSSWFANFGNVPAWGTEPYAGMPSVALDVRLRPSSSLSAPEYSLGQPAVLDLPGQPGPMPFDVVIARMRFLTPVGTMKDDPEIVTYYIGQRDHLLYKLTAAYMVSPTSWDTRTETINGMEVNPKLNPADFVFTPPPVSHEVRSTSDLFPGGRT